MLNEKKQRTLSQNAALHKYCDMLADELNAAGLEMRKVLKPEVEIIWTTESVKEYLFRPIMLAMYDIISTTDLNTKQVSKVYEVLNRHTAQKFGISLPFPSEEDQLLTNDYEN